MIKTSELLAKARALIEDPKNWCKGELAKTSRNEAVGYDDDEASKFCAFGATFRAAVSKTHDSVTVAMKTVHFLDQAALKVFPRMKNNGLRPIAFANDRLADHATILAIYDRAIEDAREIERFESLEGEDA